MIISLKMNEQRSWINLADVVKHHTQEKNHQDHHFILSSQVHNISNNLTDNKNTDIDIFLGETEEGLQYLVYTEKNKPIETKFEGIQFIELQVEFVGCCTYGCTYES